MDVLAQAIPEVVGRYFAASTAKDDEAVLRCFTEDAVVLDEGRIMTGAVEIRAWRQGVATEGHGGGHRRRAGPARHPGWWPRPAPSPTPGPTAPGPSSWWPPTS